MGTVLLLLCKYGHFMSNVPPTRLASSAPMILDPMTVTRIVVNVAVVISIIVHLVAIVFPLGLVASRCTCVLNR